MGLRQLAPDEPSVGAHNIQAVTDDGTVVARYECPCGVCVAFRIALPMMDKALRDLEAERRPEWLGT